MTTEFSHLNLHPKLVQTVAELGYTTPTDVQTQVIPLMLDGKDVIAQSQTGSGKTAAFALPILQNLIYGSSLGSVQTLVLTPTRELAIQVADAITQYGRHLQVEVMAVYGGQHYGTSKRRIKNGVDVIVGTPGRLQDLMRQDILDLSGVRTVILDEADEMLSMGFIEDIENILQQNPCQTPDDFVLCHHSQADPPLGRQLYDCTPVYHDQAEAFNRCDDRAALLSGK